MKAYTDLVKNILENGDLVENRTGIPTLMVPGASVVYDLREGFPILTERNAPFKSAASELCGFIRGYDNAADFAELGCKYWLANANDNKAWLTNIFRKGENDLGPVYGVQWREWAGFKLISTDDSNWLAKCSKIEADGWVCVSPEPGPGMTNDTLIYHKKIDQLRKCADTVVNDPTNRRILFHAWNPAVLDEVALPACHLLYQFIANPKKRDLHMCLYVRSNDIGLGHPSNAMEAAMLLTLVARLTGYTPGKLTMFLADCHIYQDHIPAMKELIEREELPLPKLKISDRIPEFAVTGKYEPEWLDQVLPSDFELIGYENHGPLKNQMKMAV